MTAATQIVSEERLLSAGWVSAMDTYAGKAIMFVSSEYPKGYRHPEKDMVKGVGVVEPAITETPARVDESGRPVILAPQCTVEGKPVTELAVLIKPTAFLVTLEHGTHELSRVYFQKGKFSVGVDTQRLGGIGIETADYDPARGLGVRWQHGYVLFVPQSHCQATWKLPD